MIKVRFPSANRILKVSKKRQALPRQEKGGGGRGRGGGLSRALSASLRVTGQAKDLQSPGCLPKRSFTQALMTSRVIASGAKAGGFGRRPGPLLAKGGLCFRSRSSIFPRPVRRSRREAPHDGGASLGRRIQGGYFCGPPPNSGSPQSAQKMGIGVYTLQRQTPRLGDLLHTGPPPPPPRPKRAHSPGSTMTTSFGCKRSRVAPSTSEKLRSGVSLPGPRRSADTLPCAAFFCKVAHC